MWNTWVSTAATSDRFQSHAVQPTGVHVSKGSPLSLAPLAGGSYSQRSSPSNKPMTCRSWYSPNLKTACRRVPSIWKPTFA